MSKLSLLTLIGMIVVACTIGIMYIKPAITDIRTIEETTSKYTTEIQKVSAVNETLTAKLSQLESQTPADSEALKRYLPDTVDEVAVMKDIIEIFATVGVTVDGITYTLPIDSDGAVDSDTVDPYAGLSKYDFTVNSVLDNRQLAQVLSALEVNDYLLQVSNLKIAPNVESGTLQVGLGLTAFSRAKVHLDKPKVK